MELLSLSLSVVLSNSYSQIHKALVANQKSVILGNNDEVKLDSSATIFAYSSMMQTLSGNKNCGGPYKELPMTTKKLFKTISYKPPDPKNTLEIALVKAGMLMTRALVPKIASFLNMIQQVLPVFRAEGLFGERLYQVLVKCMHQNFKEILRWKDNQLLSKELSTFINDEENADGVETVADLPNARPIMAVEGGGNKGVNTNNINNDDSMFDQAIQDLNKLETTCDDMGKKNT